MNPGTLAEFFRQDTKDSERTERIGLCFKLPNGKANEQYLNRLLDMLMRIYAYEEMKVLAAEVQKQIKDKGISDLG